MLGLLGEVLPACCAGLSSILQVVWGNLNPTWKETYYLYVQQRPKAVLKLRVIDKNKLRSDIDLGVVMTGLDTLLDKPGRKVELPLKGGTCVVNDVRCDS